MNLIPSHKAADIPEFIKQLEAKKHAWYDIYQNFDKRKNLYFINSASSRPLYKQRTLQDRSQQHRLQQKQFQPQSKIYFIEPHEQTTYAKHNDTVPRNYSITLSGRKTPSHTEKGDDYDYDEDYNDN